MTVLFSAREILEAAVEKEKKRKEFYSNVSELSTKADMKALFRFLMEEEVKHVATFEQIRDQLSPETHSVEYDEDMQAYMDSVIDDRLYADMDSKEFVRRAIHAKEVFRLAIGFEKDAILYFMEFLAYLTESDRKIVSELIEQEKGHIRKLAEMKKRMAE